MNMKKYRLCGIQFESGPDTEKNIEKVISYFKEAVKQKPDFVLLPEMFEIVAKPEEAINYSHEIPSEFSNTLAGMARDSSVNLVGGSFFEREGDNIYNTCLVFDRKGKMAGKYRKMHLFDAFGWGESSTISRGEDTLLLELDGLRFAVAICYDVRFPEIFRYYAVHGAKVVFLPSCFFQPNHDHWQLNIRSRALDNSIFVAASNQTGGEFVGRSMVANPWGVKVCGMGTEEGYYICDMDLGVIDQTRKKLPLLDGRRFEVVIGGGG
jgi:predicted amidohydrolase